MLTYLIIAILAAAAVIGVCWLEVKADQERAKRGEPKKHNEKIVTVITFRHHKH